MTEKEVTMIEQPERREFFTTGAERQRVPEAERYFLLIRENQRSRIWPGEINPVRYEVVDPPLMAQEIKAKACSFGADLVGITPVNQDHVYRDKVVPEKYLISLAMEMNFDQIATAPSVEAQTEVARIYYELGEVTIRLAEYIRDLGYPAYAHIPLGAGRLVQVPYAIMAGLGEQGRNGILVTPQFGCRVRLGSVTTDLPLAIDQTKEYGIGAFCDKCQLCFRACPSGAIPTQRRLDRGINRFVIDWQKCRPYFDSHHGCAICIKVCAFSRKPSARFLEKLAVPSS